MTVFSYVFLQFSKLYSLFLAPCTLFSRSSHIYESFCIHELGAHKYILLPPLPKLWYHCACLPTLSFIILSWFFMIDASICVILAINSFHCHCHSFIVIDKLLFKPMVVRFSDTTHLGIANEHWISCCHLQNFVLSTVILFEICTLNFVWMCFCWLSGFEISITMQFTLWAPFSNTVKPVCNDHFSNEMYCLWLFQ